MKFQPRTTIKGQVLTDFIAEFTYSNTAEVSGTTNNFEVAKVVRVREKEYYVPFVETLNSGSYIWMVPPTILGSEMA